MQRPLLGALCLSLAASIWGGMFVASKYVLESIPPFTLMVIRYFIGSIVLFSLLKWTAGTKTAKTKRDWFLLLWIGFIGYLVTISFQFIGVELANAHTGSLLTATTPIFLVLFARMILKEKITARKIVSLLLATTGVVIVIEWDTGMGNYIMGSIILVMAAISWSLLSVYVKLAAVKFSSLEITGYGIFFGMLMTSPLMVWELQSTNLPLPNGDVLAGIVYLGVVSTAGGFYFWNKGMELMEAGVGSLFYFFQPLVGALFGWLLLGESLSINFVIGFAIIMLSIIVVTIKPSKTKNPLLEKPKTPTTKAFLKRKLLFNDSHRPK